MSKSDWFEKMYKAWFPVLAYKRSKTERIFGLILAYGSIASIVAVIFEKMW